jgi:mannosyltransferase
VKSYAESSAAELLTTRLPTPGSVARSRSIVGWIARPLPWLLFLAIVIRLANLTYHSLWYDEVVSTFWAARPAGEIVRVGLALTQDKHPPLYYLLLRGWTTLFGQSDFSARSLGALIGALAVLPIYGIGTRLGGRRAGIIAGFLLALNPFLVWYSQEVRMFMPATTFALAGLYGLLALMDDSGATAAVLLMVCGLLAALYSYLYSAFLLPVAGAWLLWLWWLRRRTPTTRRRAFATVVALGTVALLFLPLANAAWHVSGVEAKPGHAFANMAPALANLLKVYMLGWPAWKAEWVTLLAAAGAVLAILGCVQPSPARFTRWGGYFLALWVGLVVLIGGYLLSHDSRVFGETRYQIALVPALCLAWGRGISWLWSWRRPAGALGLVFMVGVTVTALPFDWSPANRREDWREAAAFVEAHAGPNDAVLIQADYLHIAFERYFRGKQAIFYPFTDHLAGPAQVDPPLTGLAGFDAVWVVQSHNEELDPGNLVLNWFGARYPQITEVYPNGIAIHAYLQHYRTAAVPPDLPAGTVQGSLGPLRMLGCVYQPTVLPARDSLLHPPSNWIHVTSYWTPMPGFGPAEVVPRARMIDGLGQVWGEDLDWPGGTFHLWPTPKWLPGEIVRSDHDVNLNPGTPTGKYRLTMEMPTSGQKIDCGEVTITR